MTILSSLGGLPDDPNPTAEILKSMGGPQMVDKCVRQAISFCWVMLPEEQQTYEGVETQIRRIVDRALADLKNDCQAFGKSRMIPRGSRTSGPAHENGQE